MKDFNELKREAELQLQRMRDLEKQGERQYQESIADAFKPKENMTSGTITVSKAEIRMTKGEELRFLEKKRLQNVLPGYKEAAQGDPALDKILEAVDAYSKLEADATQNYMEESKLTLKIIKTLQDYQKVLDKRALDSEHDNLTDYARQRVVSSLLTQMETNMDGTLKVEEGGYRVDGTRAPFKPASQLLYFDTNHKDSYLFPHEPCANDISQGYLGDCYFVASLSEMADRHPEKIKDAMKDNGDGTVTVRFFACEPGPDGGADVYKPVFVTVDKIVPSTIRGDAIYAEDSLWVETMERAYAASGMHVFAENAQKMGFYDEAEGLHQRPVPEDIDQQYQDYKSGRKPTPTHKECPWLVDKEGHLHKWEPTYAGIASGEGAFALQALLGPEFNPRSYYYGLERKSYLKPSGDGTRSTAVDDTSICDRLVESLYLETRKGAGRDEIAKYRNSSSKLFSDLMVCYEIVTGEKCPVMPMRKGEAIQGKDKMQPDYRIPEIAEMMSFLGEVMTGGNGIFDGVSGFSKEYGEKVDEAFRKKIEAACATASPKGKEIIEKFGNMLNGKFQEVNRKYSTHERYSGEYNGLEKDLLARLQKAKSEGRMMLCATGKEGVLTDTSYGLKPNHQYTAIDTVQRTVNGKDLWFVRVRNPHAHNVIEYKVENGTMFPREAEEGNKGYMEVELSDFADNFDSFIYGEPLPELDLENEINHGQPLEDRGAALGENDINGLREIEPEAPDAAVRLLHSYDRALESIQKALKATHSKFSDDSPEFVAMEKSVAKARRNLAGLNGKAADVDAISRSLKVASDNYFNHTLDQKKTGSRRAERVNISESITYLTTIMKDREDPATVIKENFARNLEKRIEQVLKESKNPEDAGKLRTLQDENFKKNKIAEVAADEKLDTLLGKDYMTMYRTSSRPIKELSKEYSAAREEKKPEAQADNKRAERAGLF